jgi:hypothetical protein
VWLNSLSFFCWIVPQIPSYSTSKTLYFSYIKHKLQIC